MACLDTTFLIDLSRRHGSRRERARERLRDLQKAGQSVCTTRFNVAELQVGVFRCHDPEREREAIRAVLAGLEVLEFRAPAATIFARIAAHAQKIGRPVGDMDALIAATALAENERLLITRNPSHYADLPGIIAETY